MRKFFGILFNLNFLYITLIAAQVVAIIFLCIYLPAVLPSVIALAAMWTLSALCAALVLSRERGGSEVKCAWLTLIAFLPVAGAILYLISGVDRKKRGVLKVISDGRSAPAAPLSRAAGALCGTAEAGYDRAVYLPNGRDFFRRMIAEIEGAKKSVYIEFFIIGRGHIFNATLAALKKAAASGAEIRILADGLGSAFRLGRREKKLLQSIGKVKIFHPIVPLPLARLNTRDHRKIVTVDGRVAFTGGLNLSDEYANLSSPHGYWKDCGVAIYGAAAKVFEGMFLSMWERKYECELPQGGSLRCLPYCDSPPDLLFCEEAYVHAVNAATRRVHAMTPYFCVSERLASALAFAAQRGVDVRILMPHVPDKKSVFALSKACASSLTASGVQFFEYTPGFMHAKCLICDDKVFLGSYNLDYRSMHYNYECGVAFEGEIANDVERDFSDCLALSSPYCEGRLSAAKRLSRFILRLFSPLI